MAQLRRRRKRTSRRKQTQTPRIPFSPLTCVLLEIPPDRNHHRRHQPVVGRPRQFRRSDAKKEDVPTSEIRLRQGSSRGSRTQIPSQYEGTGSTEIPASPNSSRHTGGTARNLCEHAQNNTTISVVGRNPRFTNRGGSQLAGQRLESQDADPPCLPFRRRERRTKGHENGDEQHDATGSTPARKTPRRSVRRQESNRFHRHMFRRNAHHPQSVARPLQRGQNQRRKT